MSSMNCHLFFSQGSSEAGLSDGKALGDGVLNVQLLQ